MPSHSQDNTLGALGGLGGLGKMSEDDFDSLSKGLQSQSNPIANVFGYEVTPSKALTTALGVAAPPLSAPMAIGSMIADYKTNQLANKALNRPTNFMSGFSNKSLKDLQTQVDTNKDKNITQKEIQNFAVGKGRTAYSVGINPMTGYRSGTVGVTNLGKIDPSGGIVGGYETRTSIPSIYSQREVDNITSGIGQGVGATGDLGKGDKIGYVGSKGTFLGFGRTEGVDPGQSQQTGAQTSITDTTKGKDFSYTFADDAATTDSSTTYICTALYDMGDMKAYIYKYDQLYGRRVNPLTYKGYCLWGETIAIKMKRQGWTYRIAKPLALAWAKQMAFELSKGRYGKNNKVVKVLKIVGEGICYTLGLLSSLKLKKGELNGKH